MHVPIEGGHTKGGTFARYSRAMLRPSNPGPGVLKQGVAIETTTYAPRPQERWGHQAGL